MMAFAGALPTHLPDMLLNPEKELALVKKTDIQVSIISKVVTGNEPKNANTVVKHHYYHVPTREMNDLCAIIVCVPHSCVSATLNVYQDGQV